MWGWRDDMVQSQPNGYLRVILSAPRKPPSYVVECDVDCTETCHEDYMKEVNERDRGLCTAKDAIRSDSCTKCDGVAVTSSSKLLMLSAAGMMWTCYL